MTKQEMIEKLYGTYGLVRRVAFDDDLILKGDFNKTEIKVGRELEQEDKDLLTYLAQVNKLARKQTKGGLYFEEIEKFALDWINKEMK